MPRNMKAVDFGRYLQTKFYPHIATEHMFGTKITFLKTFIRSDLALRSWSHLISTPNKPLSESKLELSRDAILIVVRDWSKVLREQLTEEELAKYANNSYKEHLNRKFNTNADMQVGKKGYDGLLEATKNRTPGWGGASNRPEVGVSIQVGPSAG